MPLSIQSPINYQSTYLFISIYISIHLPTTYLSIYLSTYLSMYLSIYLSIHLLSKNHTCEYPSACGLGRFEEALPQGLLEARLKVKVLLAPANRDQQLHNSSLNMDSRKNNKKNLFKQIIAFKQIKSKLIEYINKMIDDKFLKINQFWTFACPRLSQLNARLMM